MVAPLQHPRERIRSIREPVQPEGLAPLKVLQRGDETVLVYDPTRPLGSRTVAERGTYELALAEAWRIRKGPAR